MRKFLLFFVVMIFFVPQEILAGETCDYNGINYKINGDNTTVSVATNKGLTGEVVIPGTVVYNKKYYSVTSIYSNAFRWECTGLTSITILFAALPTALIVIDANQNVNIAPTNKPINTVGFVILKSK